MPVEPNESQISSSQKYFLCNECCFWVFQLIVVALGLTVMSKVVIGYQATQEVLASKDYQHSQETVWLWKQGYIIDIKAEKTNNCPEGYETLVNHQWAGTVDGCYCTSNSNGYFFDFVLQGKCNSELISQGCQTVNSMASQTLNMWKGASLLCYKRAKSMTFYESVKLQAPEGGISPLMDTCSSNETFEVTTLPGVPCPITSFSNSTVGSSQETLSLDTSNNVVLNFINQTGYPVAAIKITEYQFCSFFNTSNISPNKMGTYLLENSNLETPCPDTDSRMVQIDSMDELNLFLNNTRVNSLISSLPAYPQPSVDYTFKLGFIPYPTWTHACRDSAPYNLYETTDRLLFVRPRQALVVAVAVVVTCTMILVVILRIFFIVRHVVDLKSRTAYNVLMLTDDEIADQIPTLEIIKSYQKECLIFAAELLLVLGMASSIVYALNILTNQSVWIKQVIKLQCSDLYMNNIFLYYEERIDFMSRILIEASFVWGVLIICQFSFFITRNYIGDLSSKAVPVESEKASNSEQIVDLDKEHRLDGNLQNESSEFILHKEDNSEVKIQDMEFIMGDIGGGETKDNFFGSDREANGGISKKKKKKRVLNKKKKEKEKLASSFIPEDEF